MTDLKAALERIVADAEHANPDGAVMGDVDEMQAIVNVGLVREMLARLP